MQSNFQPELDELPIKVYAQRYTYYYWGLRTNV